MFHDVFTTAAKNQVALCFCSQLWVIIIIHIAKYKNSYESRYCFNLGFRAIIFRYSEKARQLSKKIVSNLYLNFAIHLKCKLTSSTQQRTVRVTIHLELRHCGYTVPLPYKSTGQNRCPYVSRDTHIPADIYLSHEQKSTQTSRRQTFSLQDFLYGTILCSFCKGLSKRRKQTCLVCWLEIWISLQDIGSRKSVCKWTTLYSALS